MLKAFLNRQRSKRIARMILKNAAAPADGTQASSEHIDRMIEVAFVAISAPDASTYSERSGLISDLAHQHEGIVSSLLPIMVITFGVFENAPPSGARLNFVENIQSALPGVTSIVHGSIAASVGSFGSAERQEFGFWWPHTLDALRQLALLAPGEAIELPSQPKS